jgi:hypothetical protein
MKRYHYLQLIQYNYNLKGIIMKKKFFTSRKIILLALCVVMSLAAIPLVGFTEFEGDIKQHDEAGCCSTINENDLIITPPSEEIDAQACASTCGIPIIQTSRCACDSTNRCLRWSPSRCPRKK